MPSIHSSVSTSLAVRSQSTAGHAEIRIVLGVLRHLRERGGFEPQIHFERDRAAQVAAVSTRRSRCASARKILRIARGEREGILIELEAPLDAGPQHLHGDRPCDPPAVATSARCTCAIEAAATDGAEARENLLERLAERLFDRGFRVLLAEKAASCPAGVSRSRAIGRPTISGRVARNWPSFT